MVSRFECNTFSHVPDVIGTEVVVVVVVVGGTVVVVVVGGTVVVVVGGDVVVVVGGDVVVVVGLATVVVVGGLTGVVVAGGLTGVVVGGLVVVVATAAVPPLVTIESTADPGSEGSVAVALIAAFVVTFVVVFVLVVGGAVVAGDAFDVVVTSTVVVVKLWTANLGIALWLGARTTVESTCPIAHDKAKPTISTATTPHRSTCRRFSPYG
jgi:hypothetical protein